MNVAFIMQCYFRGDGRHDPLEIIKQCTDDFTVVFILKLQFAMHRRLSG